MPCTRCRHAYSCTLAHAHTCAHTHRCFPGTKLSTVDNSPAPLPNSCLNPEGTSLRSLSHLIMMSVFTAPNPLIHPPLCPAFPLHTSPLMVERRGAEETLAVGNQVFSPFPVDAPLPFLGSPRADAQCGFSYHLQKPRERT